ncbi:peptidase M12 [Chryseobacterium indologenes]|uniref:Peptidase M12 n=1 Tax=Chryseobacterium indologenes TaxID=253 RepID=A0AAD1DU11_CHRID|nr:MULTISPECIES: M12 family metallopeptidase [Chryseobacterium]ASE61569.1 peptidase M12 [Chryseobacterium indologenes]AYZ35357.1 peptidase M12 [Chryseobacterium indologenes]AZB17305.1 peptidase M12 [Chryseobacterium indologenes]MBF6644100.1 peptidase M12 [Chryseobacterium indologenes]MEB4763297.1 M12 family metallopeptidase [Chryseobacterium indologenes]
MELHKKILFGSFISLAMIACNTNENVEEKSAEAQNVSELQAVPKADIPAGFENTQMCKDVYLPGEGYIPGTASKGAVVTSKKWPNGTVLTVLLSGGTTKVRNKVMQYAQQWSQYANITFKFVTSGSAQIRVTFTSGAGSYSYIGKDALNIASNKETMNFGWFNDNTSDTEFSRTTIHEFGHALGMIHEHQHPLAAIPWDKPKVYAYYAGYPNYWTQAQVDNNLFAKYSTSQTQYSAYDKLSIMHYSISSDLTTNGFSVGNNTVLSATDKQFIASVYPK